MVGLLRYQASWDRPPLFGHEGQATSTARPNEPAKTLANFDAIAVALHGKGPLGVQTEKLTNNWLGTSRMVDNAVWLTAVGRQAVEAL